MKGRGKLALFVTGLCAYVGGSLLAIDYFSTPTRKAAQELDQLTQQTFDKISDKYDSEISFDEKILGVQKQRKKLLASAHGKVLEVSAGTGRNFEYYPKGVDLSVVDLSPMMLEKAKNKIKNGEVKVNFEKVQFAVMPSEQLSFPDQTFDTVVDTFGLCSVNDPIKALKEMQRVCKKDGKILLLEHGRSEYSLLSDYLDRKAYSHKEKWGCWWNRDMKKIMKESSLQINQLDEKQFKSCFYVIAQPHPQFHSTTNTPSP
eukprot:TRINITY_DN2565_c0_g1_i1.p1 TRINITY_DN2565_c0_g1~~TRINITY_DN2565_c0_g1_i1.p1  ORF type:complete len:259 (-),score=69.04 TRINITY_DN2565_c0_g1_i1:196-972(-)